MPWSNGGSSPWSTDDITPQGRKKLLDYGIAPPLPCGQPGGAGLRKDRHRLRLPVRRLAPASSSLAGTLPR